MGSVCSSENGGTLSNQTKILDTSIYSATNCTFSGSVYFDTTPDQTEGLPFMSLAILESFVESKGLIHYSAPSYVVAQTRKPQSVTLKNSFFGPDAVFQITGTLPPGSAVEFSNNTMSASALNPYLDFTFLTLVVLSSLSLSANTTLNLLNNVFAIDGTANNAVQVISSVGDLYATTNSAFGIQNNTFSASGDGAVISFDSLFFDSEVPLSIENNTFTTTSAGISLLHCQEWSTSDITVPASFNVSQNLFHSTVPITGALITVGQFTIAEGSSLSLLQNEVSADSVTSTDVKFLSATSVSSNATVFHCNNSLPWETRPTAEQLFSSNLLSLTQGLCDAPTTTTTTPTTTTTATSTTTPTTTTTATSTTTPTTTTTATSTTTPTTTTATTSSPTATVTGQTTRIVPSHSFETLRNVGTLFLIIVAALFTM